MEERGNLHGMNVINTFCVHHSYLIIFNDRYRSIQRSEEGRHSLQSKFSSARLTEFRFDRSVAMFIPFENIPV